MNRFFIVFSIFVLFFRSPAAGQFWDGATGLLQSPSADMNPDGTFMITDNFMNKHSLSNGYWGYHSFEYGISINLWSRLEVGYVCVILDGKRKANPSPRDKIMFNQDRHFTVKALILREGDFGWDWIPALAVGVSDPTTGAGADYIERAVSGSGNGFFNRNYIVATKHTHTRIGTVGMHLGYQFNRRTDIPIHGPCVALDWVPVWLNTPAVSIKAIAEFDSRTFNIGFIASFWENRFETMFELMAIKWVNFGVRYKLLLKS